METQIPLEQGNFISIENQSANEFAPGSSVIYAMYGKCFIQTIETRQINGETIRFYKLEIQKSALSRSTKQEPAIWLPVKSARDRGLRSPMNQSDAEAALAILSSREYYFPLNENWHSVFPKLENSIRTEGSIGLAKVASYLYVLKKKQIVSANETIKFDEHVRKLLMRELSDALGESSKILEEQINKGFRQKLIPDT